MGSRIACHFAGIGVQVLLLDIVPKDTPADAKPVARNKIVNDALAAAIKSNPSPVYHKDVIKKITTGNFENNMKDIAGCDWIIEVVVERLDIKQKVFEQVEQYRKPGTLITSNTSGIPISMMAEGQVRISKSISAAHTSSIRQDICGCWKLFLPRIPTLLLLTF